MNRDKGAARKWYRTKIKGTRTCKVKSSEGSEEWLLFSSPKSYPTKDSTVPVVGVLNFCYQKL